MIRVLIADDHALMRDGLKAMLGRAKDIEVVGEARDGLEAVEEALNLAPDVVLMDLMMPDVNGIKAAEQIHALTTDIKVLFVSGHADELVLRQALKTGAHGYLVKTANPMELPLAIRAVHRGEMYFSPEVFSVLSEELAR
ncbi:MAG: response regulator transcription factor [Chloroflexi bacterium]|nr:response regulator transcription factor [Chloroflexota bacterium]